MRNGLFGVATLIFLSTIAQAVGQGQKPIDLPACQPGPARQAFNSLELALGRDLFYDPILSGNRTVACATCHHPALGTSDGVALSFGDGGIGMGPKRRADAANLPEQRIPRNAQSLFNLVYDEFSVLFHDGRVERLPDGMIRTPLGPIPESGPLSILAAQAAFPVISADEMAGHGIENDIAAAVRNGLLQGPDGAYGLLAARVAAIPSYRDRFAKIAPGPIGYPDIARVLAAFMAAEWRADDSAFDRLICNGIPLPARQRAGMVLFYGKAGCSTCHSGRFQTDHAFHAIAMPQIGPGKADGAETHARDVGRMLVTGDERDAYRFRTPSLRNIALTAPFGHAGAFADLASVIRHHLDPVGSIARFDADNVAMAPLDGADDFRILRDKAERSAIAKASVLAPIRLSEDEIAELVAFLDALTDLRGVEGRLGVPKSVPSGLPVPEVAE